MIQPGRLLAALTLFLLVTIAPARADGPQWHTSLAKARSAAARSRKPILCIVARQSDARADKLMRDLGKNRKLAALLPSFVPVRLDRTRSQDLVKKYDLKYSPSTIFFTSRGVPTKVIAGPISNGKFAVQMEAVIEKYKQILNPSRGAPKLPERHEPPPRPQDALPHGETCPEACPTCTTTIDQALAFLARQQRGSGKFTKPEAERITKQDGKTLTRSIDRIDVALTALAGLAFLADGSTLEEGRYSRNLRRADKFVQSAVRDDGIICAEEGSNYVFLVHANFETSLGAMFLAEMEKLAPDPDRLAKIRKTADYLTRIQDPRSGGWGYSYDFREFSSNDKRGWRLLATTHCCLTALNHMRDAGARIPEETLTRGAKYLLACRCRDGSFTYRSEFRRGEGYPGATGGALYALARSGATSDADLALSRRWFRMNFPKLGKYGKHWWFNLLYTGLAMNDRGPGTLSAFHRHFRDVIAANQRDDGSFDEPDGNGGSILATAAAVIVLSLPFDRMPLAGVRTGPGKAPEITRPKYLKPPHPASRVKVIERRGAYLVDLVISTDGEVDSDWFKAMARGIREANRILYDVTDGGMYLRRVEILGDKQRWDEADLMVTTSFHTDTVLPQPFAHGFTMVSKRTKIRGSKEYVGERIGEWVKLPFARRGGTEPYHWDRPALVRVIAHELGHYLFGAKDEYNTRTGESYCECLMGNLRVTELCGPKDHTDTRQERSCREQVRALYPKIRFPSETDPGPWDPPEPEIVIPKD